MRRRMMMMALGRLWNWPTIPSWDVFSRQLNSEIATTTPIATRSAMGADLSGTSRWTGGVLGPDGKIYGIPYSSTDILIIDPVAGTATRSAMGADLSGSTKWFGGVLGPDGKIYGIPFDSTDILAIAHDRALSSRLALDPRLNKF